MNRVNGNLIKITNYFNPKELEGQKGGQTKNSTCCVKFLFVALGLKFKITINPTFMGNQIVLFSSKLKRWCKQLTLKESQFKQL